MSYDYTELKKEIQNITFTYKKSELKITITSGITEYSKKKDLLTIINEADKALYQGKQDGKNCVKSFPDIEAKNLFN